MSKGYKSPYTQPSPAPHGRILTQNSSLSARLLDEKSADVVPQPPQDPAPHKNLPPKSRRTSVDSSTALNVVRSQSPSQSHPESQSDVVNVNTSDVADVAHVVRSDTVTAPSRRESIDTVKAPSRRESVEYVVVSKSRLSLNTATNPETQLVDINSSTRRDNSSTYNTRRDNSSTYNTRRESSPTYNSRRDNSSTYNTRRESSPTYNTRRENSSTYPHGDGDRNTDRYSGKRNLDNDQFVGEVEAQSTDTEIKFAEGVDATNTAALTPDTLEERTDDLDENEKQPSHRYSYHSLKRGGNASRNSVQLHDNQPNSQRSLNGDGTDNLQGDVYANSSKVTGEGDFQYTDHSNNSYSSNFNSRSNAHSAHKKVKDTVAQGDHSEAHRAPAVTEKQPSSHRIVPHPPGERSFYSHQHTRLSLNSRHDRVSRKKEPAGVNPIEQAVPPLDLSQISPERTSPVSDIDSDSSYSPALQTAEEPHSLLLPPGQNLHASGHPGENIVHFSPHDYNPPSTRRTYEVDTPNRISDLPHIKSSDNFRDEQGSPQPLGQDTYRQVQGPGRVEPHRSDLADDLNVPYPFDTQAQNKQDTDRHIRPPSPPVQTTPPPATDPATSLRSNSKVYAVANPEVLRAQGITPSDRQFTPRQHSGAHSKYGDQSVKFDSAPKRHPSERGFGTPIRDRAPTPYTRSPDQDRGGSPGEIPGPSDWDVPDEQPKAKSDKLPPQHPPLDTKHSSKPGSVSTREAVKRVYVESPSFTKAEEDEYRFVNSRLEDTDDKDPATVREMERQRGYGGDDNGPYRRNDRVENKSQGRGSDYSRRKVEMDDRDRDRYDTRNRDRYEEQNGDRGRPKYDDRNRDRYDERDRYNDRDRDRERYRERDPRERDSDRYNDDRGRYEDRNQEMNGYSDNTDQYRGSRDEDRFEDQDGYYDPYGKQERYERLKGDRSRYEREPRREEESAGYRKQNTEMDEQDLRKEREYQRELKNRLNKQKVKDAEPYEPVRRERDYDYDKENNFARDSLEYPVERDRQEEQGYSRDNGDNGDYNNYLQQNRAWENPPQNPYQNPPQNPYQEAPQPSFFDAADAEQMEIVNPTQPKYDYIENNKTDYGMLPKKSYRNIVHKKKEEEEKLDKVFITPKVPSKAGKRPAQKKARSAQPEHLGYQPPVQEQYPLGFKPSSAEELWAKKAAVLSNKKGSADSSAPNRNKGSAGKGVPTRWNSNPQVKHKFTADAPPPLPNQGQMYRPPNANYSGNQRGDQGGYTTPTRQLQPMENRPAPPANTELVPTAVNPASPFRRHMELKPITQEILTEDGQRISVDINLRLVSPPPGPGSPHQQQQLALVPVQETQAPVDDGSQRAIGVPYQMQDQYGNYDNGYNGGYQDMHRQELKERIANEVKEKIEKKKVKFGMVQNAAYDPTAGIGDDGHVMNIRDLQQRITEEELALADPPEGYARKYKPGMVNFRDDEDDVSEPKSQDDEGYAAQYHRVKNKDPNEKPWFPVYNIKDYKKMMREVRLNRGTLGPDLDTEPYKEKMEKRHKQFEYARMVMEKNRMELSTKKPPQFPRQQQKQGEENVKRKAALDYAKNVPKPSVKARPNQYNSYEVAAQLTPGGTTSGTSRTRGSPTLKSTPPPSQTVDVIDIRTLEQRHLQEKKTTDKIRQNMDSVLSQKAH